MRQSEPCRLLRPPVDYMLEKENKDAAVSDCVTREDRRLHEGRRGTVGRVGHDDRQDRLEPAVSKVVRGR